MYFPSTKRNTTFSEDHPMNIPTKLVPNGAVVPEKMIKKYNFTDGNIDDGCQVMTIFHVTLWV